MTEAEFLQEFEDAVAKIATERGRVREGGYKWVAGPQGVTCPINTIVKARGGECTNGTAYTVGQVDLGLTKRQTTNIIAAADNIFEIPGKAGTPRPLFAGTREEFDCFRAALDDAIERGLARRKGRTGGGDAGDSPVRSGHEGSPKDGQ